MRKVGGGRNFGWGKQMAWAGKQALRAAFGGGHYATVASHAARWRKFCQWAREHGVRDARDVSRSELARFAEHLSQQTGRDLSNGYAKNQLTSVNVVLESMRGDRALWVRPSDYIGQRDSVRTDAPAGLDRDRLRPVVERLTDLGKARVAAVALLVWAVYLLPPMPMDPRWVLPPFVVAFAIALRLRVSFFKKHL